MEKSKLRKVAMGVALTAVAGLLLYAVQAPAEAPQYLTATVERGDIENAVLATGLLEGIKQVDVGAQVSGQLKSLKVKVGDKVKKGQWLAEIDPLVLQNTLRQAQVDEENLQAQKRATQAQLRQTKALFERYRNLQEDASISRQDFETAQSNYEVQQANLLSLDAQIKSAHIQIDTAKVNLAYTRIIAPIDGDVVGIVTQEGQTVIANQLAPILLKLADLDTMTVKAQVSEADVIHIAPGQEVYFTILGEDKRYYGKLRGTEPAPQNFLETPPAGTPKQNTAVFYNALFEVPNPDHRLRISMTAQVRVVLDTAKSVLTIPVAALGARNSDGSYPVRVLDAKGQAQVRTVQVGINNNVKVQINDGLAEGDRVVIGDPVSAVAGS
ncbi:efflux transporter periplasmic adaptor subunit [Pseudomonas moraviensis]|jgi:macrolide-specific efflux system membrane fusion protein|uniref:Efflux transporter periplasmic adaptor subunit n=2 Tax=Pseudomonas fluorescens group TaxID=136843 RepID=A0A423NRF5_9PSED|nr:MULTISPECIES: macrolide transporter subunit MacA [Pseudomonas]KIP91373.1 hemolysin secretion protein D [Pseudomonas fluorescens]KPG85160.1 hemolysin secretion protein D [Pseudomonas sp. RIT-PI-o]PWB37279.1 macrolide transporter subunit MacA [Pseudomonas sp. NDM]ROO00834.1 efflux transporter periplasmic adaptor subunit [Pseudomonas moraviensis]UEB98023.1 macrolide transporter subunit MacA [Pseudomonas sp. HN2]